MRILWAETNIIAYAKVYGFSGMIRRRPWFIGFATWLPYIGGRI